MLPLHVCGGVCQQAHDFRFTRSNIDIAGNRLARAGDLLLRSLDEGQYFLCPLAQDHAFLRQQHLARTFYAPDQQLFPQFRFHRLELCGQRRLRDVQGFRRSRYILFTSNRQKVFKHPQFHFDRLPNQYNGTIHKCKLLN